MGGRSHGGVKNYCQFKRNSGALEYVFSISRRVLMKVKLLHNVNIQMTQAPKNEKYGAIISVLLAKENKNQRYDTVRQSAIVMPICTAPRLYMYMSRKPASTNPLRRGGNAKPLPLGNSHPFRDKQLLLSTDCTFCNQQLCAYKRRPSIRDSKLTAPQSVCAEDIHKSSIHVMQ